MAKFGCVFIYGWLDLAERTVAQCVYTEVLAHSFPLVEIATGCSVNLVNSLNDTQSHHHPLHVILPSKQDPGI